MGSFSEGKYVPPGEISLKIFGRRGATELISASESLASSVMGSQCVFCAVMCWEDGCAKKAPVAQQVLQQSW